MKGFDNDRFLDYLGKIPWHTACIFDETDDICVHWYQLFIDAVDQRMPYKKKYIRGDQLPWITPGISSAIHYTSSSFQTASNPLWSINYKKDEVVGFNYRPFSLSHNKKIESKPFNEINQKLGML